MKLSLLCLQMKGYNWNKISPRLVARFKIIFVTAMYSNRNNGIARISWGQAATTIF